MTDSLYIIYQNDTVQLVGSLIIKSDITADAMNNGVLYDGGSVDYNNKSSWRYYRHLAGEYHTSDTPMYVLSHDTQERILFNKANLQIHRTTALNYKKDKRYLNGLIEQYPMQFNLIKGILNPIQIMDAISAEDGTILYYDADLVEDNELTLIHDIQANINAILSRWYNADYSISDELYPGVFYLVLTSALITITLNQRLDRCKTSEAHSYHIREYLASRNDLDQYIDMLNKKQLLWLYRNIDYIRANIGKQEILDTLIDNILTPRGIPVGDFRIEQNIEDIMSDGVPTGELVSFPINTTSSGVRDRFLSVAEMLIKERGIAAGNEDAEVEALPATESLLARSGFNTLPTKILESKMVDLGEYTPVILTDTLYHYWGYLSSIGFYRAIIEVSIGGKEILLPVKDAFVLYTYALYKAAGISLSIIPTFYADNILKRVRSTFTKLRSITDKKLISDEKIFSLLANIPAVNEHISVITFNENVTALHRRYRQHRFQWAQMNDGIARGMVEGAARHMYHTLRIEVANEGTFEEWFNVRRFDFSTVTKGEWETAAVDIFKKATGWVEDKSLAEIQAGLIGLVERLTSYTIQWIYEINHGRVMPLDIPTLMPSNITLRQYLAGRIRPIVDFKLSSARARIYSELNRVGEMTGKVTTSVSGAIPPPSLPTLDVYNIIMARLPLDVYDVLQLIPDVIPPGGGCPVDSETAVLFNDVIFNLTFDVGSVGGIVDTSTYNRQLTIVNDGHLSIVNSGLLLDVPDGGSYNGSIQLRNLPPIIVNYSIVGNIELLPVSYVTALELFKSIYGGGNYDFKTTITITSDASGNYFITNPNDRFELKPITSGTHKIEYRARGSINYVLVDDVVQFVWVKPANLAWSGSIWFEPITSLYGSYAVRARLLDVKLTNEYDGPPWWQHCLVAYNFNERYPEQIQDKSPFRNRIESTDFDNIFYDLSVVPEDACHRAVKMIRAREAFGGSAGVRSYPVYCEGGNLSFEFSFWHNGPSFTLNNQGFIFEFVNDNISAFVALEHPLGSEHAYMAFFGANYDDENESLGVYHRWIKCEPNIRRHYVVNHIDGVATVHVDGVLYLSGTVEAPLITDTSNTCRIMGYNSSPTGISWEISRVVVTNNYYLDPAKYRKVEEHYSILPTIVPTLYDNYLLMSALSDTHKLVAFDSNDNNINLDAVGFIPFYMSYNKVDKILALVGNNSNQVVLYNTAVTPWVGSYGPTVPNDIIGINYSEDTRALLVSYVNSSNKVVDRLYDTTNYSNYTTLNDQATYTGVIPKRTTFTRGGDSLYIINGSSSPRITRYDISGSDVYNTVTPTITNVSKITAIAKGNSFGGYIAMAVRVADASANEVRIYSTYMSFNGVLVSYPVSAGLGEIVNLAWSYSDDQLAIAFDSGTIHIYTITSAGSGEGYPEIVNQVPHTTYLPNIAWSPVGLRLVVNIQGESGFTRYTLNSAYDPMPSIFEGDMFYTPYNGPGGGINILFLEGAAAPGAIQPPV